MTRRRWNWQAPKRRNRLSKAERRAVWAIAAASGILAMFAGCEPTRTTGFDLALTGAFAVLVTWAGATAPWWALAVSATVLAIADPTGWRVVVAVAACAAVLVVGAGHKAWAVPRTIAAAACVQVALRLDIDSPFGRSALIAAATLGLIVVTGIARKHHVVRRRALYVLAGVGVVAGIGLVGAAFGALSARGNIERGVDAAQAGLTALRAGEPETASTKFEEAARALGRAKSVVNGPLMWPARLVPVLSQHVYAGAELVDAARDASSTVSESIGGIDLDSVRLRGGYIDLAALADLEVPLSDSADAVRQLDDAVREARSGWLVAPVDSRLGTLQDETTSAMAQATNALEVTRVAPRLLGADGKRVWFVLFTTPSEARGLGGFPGNFAELTADGGFVSVTRFGRATDLINGGSDPAGRTISGPADFLTRYGAAGAGGNGVPAERLFWNNVTLSPDLPTVASVVAELYPQSGGGQIDGVIVADPIALQGLVALTGPLTIEGRAEPLTGTNTAQFLLRDQYTEFPGADNVRKDALEDVAQQATTALLLGDLPSPAIIARALGDPVRSGHLMVWSLHEADQDALRRLGVSGAMPAPPADGIAYTINNAGPNKLDAYLTRALTYDATVDESTGQIGATLTIRLRNTVATPVALPEDVASNNDGLPIGTNRTWLTVYSPLQAIDADVDGERRALASGEELGWHAYTTYLDIGPDEEQVLTVHLAGRLDLDDGYSLTMRTQPLANPEQLDVQVRDVHGARLVDHASSLSVVTTLMPSA